MLYPVSRNVGSWSFEIRGQDHFPREGRTFILYRCNVLHPENTEYSTLACWA
jgi:hypothetical protein